MKSIVNVKLYWNEIVLLFCWFDHGKYCLFNYDITKQETHSKFHFHSQQIFISTQVYREIGTKSSEKSQSFTGLVPLERKQDGR